MKFKLQLRTVAAIFSLVASVTVASAQQSQTSVPTIDPTTGLPLPQAAPQWKDPNWKDPAKVLSAINWPEGLPLSEVVRYLRDQFTNDFDIIMPEATQPGNNSEPFDASAYEVKLILRNVTASEVFGAMNLEFKDANVPFRWELTMNGRRPTALLRNVPTLLSPAPPQQRRVFFVGDLISGPFGSMTMPQIVQTTSDVWAKAYGQSGVIQFYDPAQLVIVTGTPDQIDFIEQTLVALRKKAELNRMEHSKSAGSDSKTAGPKSDASTGSK